MKVFWTCITVGLFALLAIWSGCEDPNPITGFQGDTLTFEQRLAIEEDSIEQFILEQGFDSVFVTSNGLRIVPLEDGAGEIAQFGDILSVDYSGSFLYGDVFDTTIEEVAMEADIFSSTRTYAPFVTNLGSASIIDGWNEGLSYMRENSKVIMLIPSHLAYGLTGFFPIIGPYRVLKFEMELVKIRR